MASGGPLCDRAVGVGVEVIPVGVREAEASDEGVTLLTCDAWPQPTCAVSMAQVAPRTNHARRAFGIWLQRDPRALVSNLWRYDVDNVLDGDPNPERNATLPSNMMVLALGVES
jgi:hypothetical protein